MTARDRMLDKAREKTLGTYVAKFVAPEFQKMIRAEAGSIADGTETAVVDGNISPVVRRVGQVVCVTCGKVGPWSSGLSGMHTGHFLASRRNSIIFDEDNVAPQCSSCNRYHGGMPQQFRLWMLHERGVETINRLERLKHTVRTFTREELVDMRIEFKARLKVAEHRMRNSD